MKRHINAPQLHTHRAPRVAILGAGAAGLCMAMQLARTGRREFTIFEKADRLGGTWRDNTYPGAGCDVPSHLYSFSFAPNPGWTRLFSGQAEILAYLERCATDHGLHRHIRFGSEIAEARFDDHSATWQLRTAAGEDHEADILITGCGQLNRPHVPPLSGLDQFQGAAFHSARWDHGCDVTGRRVAVIGNGASAIQFIPWLADRAEHVAIFQRSPNWIIPRNDRAYTERETRRYRQLPGRRALHRYGLYWRLEGRFYAFARVGWINQLTRRTAVKHLDQISDPALRAALTPDYSIGCKRILISDDYYQTLERPNVAVITRPIARIGRAAIETDDGAAHPVDAIVFATGFESTRFLAPIEITGAAGRKLGDAWRDGAEAYLGMLVAGFPNLFMLYGPNTNLGHNSILFMIECQTRYILRCMAALKSHNARSIDVKPAVMTRYNENLQARLRDSVWNAGCTNWYTDEAGKITNNWASFTAAYWWQTRRPDLTALDLKP